MKRLTLVLVGLLLAAAPALAQQDGMNFRADFRGQKINRELFALTGPNAREQMFEEPEGLRIVLPSDAERQDPIGLVTRFPIRGDFEITAAYEILRSDKPSAGYGTGPSLYLYAKTPSREAINFGRYHRIDSGQVYALSRNFDDPEKGKRQYKNFPPIPSEALKGKLRLVRKGKEISFQAAEGDGDDFKELKKLDWGEYDLMYARIAADPGTSKAPVEVRFADFAIRSGNAPKDMPAPPQVADVGPPPASSRRWVLWLVAGLVVVGLVVSGAVWLFLQTRRDPEPAAVKRPPRAKA